MANARSTIAPTWVTDLLGDDASVVAMLSGGTSRDTVLVEVPTLGTRVVARHDRGAGPLSGTPFTLAREAATSVAVSEIGLPVATVSAVADDGLSFAVTELPGASADRGEALDDLLGVIGRLHRDRLDHAPPGEVGFDAAGREDLRIWSGIARDRIIRPVPIVVRALDVLGRHHDPSAPVVLCHGDAGTGNYLYDGQTVTGLVDWEMAHSGDPHDDLASIAVRAVLNGVDLGDFVGRIRAAYEPVSEQRFDAGRHLVGIVAVLTRMVISCLAAIDHAESETDRSVQLMGLPLMEVHLVRALAQLERVPLPDIQISDVDADHGFAAEVLAAVADGVGHGLRPHLDGWPAGLARRLSYLGRQVSLMLSADPSSSVTVPSDPSDLDQLWRTALGRLAVVGSSRSIAFAPIPGVA